MFACRYICSLVKNAVHNFELYVTFCHVCNQGFLGLSGAVLIQVYDTIFESNPSTFLLFLALLPSATTLLLMCLVRIYEASPAGYKKHLNAFSAVALTIAAYLMILIILENVFSFTSWARIVTLIFLMILLASPLGIAIRAQKEDTDHRLSQTLSDERSLLLDNTSSKFSTGKNSIAPHESPRDAFEVEDCFEDMNLIQAMCTVNFWLLFIAMICGMGSGLATINNISQVGESLGYTTIEINSLVALLSIWNFLGRFGAGYISDILLHEKGWARPLFIVITLALLSVGHIVIASGFPKNLYVGSIIVGVSYGSQWSLMPTITSEIFGVAHMGTIFNTIAIASPVGSYIFSVRVIGYIYDKIASDEHNSCRGAHCFMLSFLIMASVAIFGCVIAFLLFFRTRRFYNHVVLRKLKH